MPLVGILLLSCVLAPAAAWCVGGSASGDQAIVQRYIEQLREAEYPGHRTTAAVELGRLGPRASAAVQALLEATGQEGSYRLRAEAVKALGAIAPEDPAVLKRIADLLDYRTERGRLAATAQKTLARIGPPAIPVLIEKLESQWDEFGEDDILGTWGMAAPALGRIGRPALPAVLAAFEDPRRRMGAAEALRVMGRAAAPDAVPVLIAHARDRDVHVRCMVHSALAAMGPAASPAIPALTVGLGDSDGICAERAARALGAIGPPARTALPALKQLLDKTRSSVVKAAIQQIQGH